MLRTVLFNLVVAILVDTALPRQVPSGSDQRWQDDYLAIDVFNDRVLAGWSLDRLPNPDTTDHLVFETVHSLLQQWPNTRMRNGHSIVPASIPKGTLLYHGRADGELPKGPEWVATDPEHSYLFCRNMIEYSQKGGWHLTLMAMRPLKMVYFDGSSAAKVYGAIDTQELMVWGRESNGNMFEDEPERIRRLCEWAQSFGVDGIVRMQMDFEIMLCDFTSGVSVISFENLASKWSSLSSWISISEMFEVINSGASHNRFPGETRIQLDLPGLVSFYDTQLAPSLVPIRADQERWQHRAINISSEDWLVVKSRLEANLLRSDDASSGIDWKTLLQVIVDRYAERLELTRYLLKLLTTGQDGILDLAKKVQVQLRIMLTPYLLSSVLPTDDAEPDWAIPIYKLCATTHTHSMESLFTSMTDSEKLLLQAIRGTNQEICRVITKMWTAGIYAGIDPLLNTKESPDVSEVARLQDTWADYLERLMAWLDWSVWIKCDPGCDPEEMCYLPTWPIGFPWLAPDWIPPPPPIDDYAPHLEKMSSFTLRTIVMHKLASGISNAIKPEPDEWIRPQPKCIRRVAPYRF